MGLVETLIVINAIGLTALVVLIAFVSKKGRGKGAVQKTNPLATQGVLVYDMPHEFLSEVTEVLIRGMNKADIAFKNGYVIPYDPQLFHLHNKLEVLTGKGPLFVYGANGIDLKALQTKEQAVAEGIRSMKANMKLYKARAIEGRVREVANITKALETKRVSEPQNPRGS